MTVCAACGHVNQHAAKFCSECGVALEAEATTALEERKYVTVLFADLVDFTSRAERMDPEDVRALLSPYYARLRSELEHFGGTVEKFIGDAVMALFGAPTAHDDDPERAVRAAIAIRDWLVEDGQLQVRIGVNTGEVLVTLAARSAEGEGMAAGDVINTAARLQAAAPPNGILVGAGTHRATRNAVEYRSGASVRAKGKENPVPAWEAVRARSRFGVDVPHEAKSELIGRDGELRMLAEALARVRRERSTQLVTIVGVPGMGKSRLLYELSRIVDSESDLIAWRQGRSLPYGEGVSLWALVEMVKAQAGILESDAAAEAEAKLAAMVADVLTEPGELEWVRRHLNVLLGFGEDVGSATGDRRSEAFAGYRRLFEALADARPLVAVFEDLHWADDGLLDFVDHLIDWAGDVPLLVVCSARPELFERRPGWGGGKSNAVTISLSPLSDNDTARLIGSLMGRPVVEAELQQQLLSRAGGNPLFTEQFVQMQAEQANAGALSLPDSVQGIVSARLDALAAPDKQLLQDAAVIGKVFWPSAVAALAGAGDRGSLEEALHRLERKQFVRRERQSSIGTQTQYAFQHILLRDVAYGQIPRSVRAGKHALAARWIQSLGRPDEYAEMLAHHFMSALEFARAAGQHTAALASDARGAIIEAAERASALNAHPSAVRFYREALALSPDVPRKSHADLLFGLALATLRAGEDEPDAAFEAARTALLAIDDRPRAAVLDAEMSRVWWERGDGDRSAEHGARAHDLVRDEPATPEKAVVLASLARHLMLAGNLDTSLADEALALSESLGLAEVHADVLVTLGTAHGFAKDPNGPIEIRRALDAALAGNFLATAIRAYSNLAVLAERDGDLREGADAGRQAEAVAQRLGSWSALRWTRGNRVGSLLVVGEWDECARLADEAISQSETLGPHYLDAQAYFARALLSIARERIDAALVNQVAGLASARRAQDPQVLYSTLASSAYVLAEAGHLDESRALLDELLHTANADKADMFAYAGPEVALTAETIGRREELRLWLGPALGSAWTQAARAILADDFAQALSLIEPMGAIFTASVIRLRAGKHLIQQGQRDEAQAMLQPAITFFKSVGATHYLRTAQALLAA